MFGFVIFFYVLFLTVTEIQILNKEVLSTGTLSGLPDEKKWREN